MNFDAELAASVSLLAFAALSFVDGVVLHFFLERLPFRPGSRLEHGLHTARAVLFAPVLLAFFDARASLATGLALLAVDLAFEVWDMLIERQSRAFSGGLRTREYALHGVLVALHTAAVAFTLVARQAPARTPTPLSLAAVTGWLLPGSTLVALAHVVLLAAPTWAAHSRATEAS
ncbi:MAG TPA: hypothetical protein VFS43_20990 [Polyangiaceae bacterium]|nr:hypothetical protein [Polyangiaceae bacterium]